LSTFRLLFQNNLNTKFQKGNLLPPRTHTKLIKGSRKNRIARGSGTGPQDVNKLLKQFEKMQKQMKKISS
jgi:hypothetical protein